MKKSLLAMLLVVIMALALFGCGGNDSAQFVGRWENIASYIPCSFDLNSDGSGYFQILDKGVDGTWEVTSSGIRFNDAEWQYEDGYLVNADLQMVMEKQ